MKRIVNAFLDDPNRGMRACAAFVLCATTAIALPAQTFTTLHSFDYHTDGCCLMYGLVQASNGNLYGTTEAGGANVDGTVFKITPTGRLTTLHNFLWTDGAFANGLVQAADGNLYGTAQEGGAYGYGTAFKITPEGTLTTLHNFDGTDGNGPYFGLVQAASGDLYGTTSGGGANNNALCSPLSGLAGCGTVFKITPSGTLTTLYNFCSQIGCTDGAAPFAGLVQATNGDFYGTTGGGGVNGAGTVFKITPSGSLTTLYSFCCADGSRPYAGLVQGTDGNLYGTTLFGGATTVSSGCSSPSGCGTVFKITPSGSLTTLYNFCSETGCADGWYPYAGLIQDTNGTFYGTTEGGGAANAGTVFSLSVGLGPFVETLRTYGTVGAVEILGTDLTGATSVSFNGTAAAFTVVAPSLITATVPVGASSGTVQVVTPSGTLSSNVPFRVLP